MEMNDRIYLAAPWFKPEELKALEILEGLCDRYGWPVFSPRKECLLSKDASREQQERAFRMNIDGILGCRLVLACVEGLDPGTIFEMGVAHNRTPLVIWSYNDQRKLNVMLAQASQGYLAGWHKVEDFLRPQAMADRPGNDFNWGVCEKWTKEIY